MGRLKKSPKSIMLFIGIADVIWKDKGIVKF